MIDPWSALLFGGVIPGAGGAWSRSVPVPNLTALLGVQIEFQAAMLDATSPTGWRPTTPWRATLGN